jgi:ABC-type glycerol-3-phosphate transport system substrate-binding protein
MSTFSEVRIAVTAAGGGAGTSSGNTTSGSINGVLYSLYVKLTSAPATIDVTITEVGGASRTLLTLTNLAASGEYPLAIAQVGPTGTALTSYIAPALGGSQINVAVAQANVGTLVEVFLYVLE